MITQETIKELLLKGDDKSNVAVERALIVLYARQTAAEQMSQQTTHTNGVGFNAVDAELLSSFACQVERKRSQGAKAGTCLSQKQMELARKKVARYSRQLVEAAQEKAAAGTPGAAAAGAVKVSYWLRSPGKDWTEVSPAWAAEWMAALLKEIARRGETVKVKPLAGAQPGETWINYGYQCLTVEGEGQHPSSRDNDKEPRTASVVWGSSPESKALDKAEALHQARETYAQELKLKTVYYNGRKTVDIARERVETLEQELAWDIQAEREDALRGSQESQGHSLETLKGDPEAREFRAAKSKISDWLAR